MDETKVRRGFTYYIASDSDPEKHKYIGSSMETPKKRKSQHRCLKRKSKTGADMITSQFPDWDLRVIEWYEFKGTKEEARKELRQHEQRLIEMAGEKCVNKNNAVSGKEKREPPVVPIRDHFRENRDRMVAWENEYNKAQRECPTRLLTYMEYLEVKSRLKV